MMDLLDLAMPEFATEEEREDFLAKTGRVHETAQQNFAGGYSDEGAAPAAGVKRMKMGAQGSLKERGLTYVHIVMTHEQKREFETLIAEVRALATCQLDTTAEAVLYALEGSAE